MSDARIGAALHAVRAVEPLTAPAAVAWFTPGAPSGGEVVGYTLSARSATWVRVRSDGTVQDVREDGDALAEAYELVLFDGERELRWLRTPDGCGIAVAVGEDPASLPAGRDVTAEQPTRRGDTFIRQLEGEPHPHRDPNWTTLRSGRYAEAHLPFPCPDRQVLAIERVEYLIEDDHGNLDVADTRTIGLRPTSISDTTTGPERTTP